MSDHPLATYLPAERFGPILTARPFAHGLSLATVYDVSTERGDYVVRIAGHTDVAQWRRELAILRLASDAGIAPPLVWVDDTALATVSKKIDGQVSAALADPSARPRAIASLVATLATLHRLPADGIGVADPVQEARRLWRDQSGKPGFPAWAASAVDRIDRCERLLAADDRRVVSHNDVNPTNVLWDGERVWLVDWTAAGLSHPYYDLAVAAMFLRLDDAVALDLLGRQEGTRITPAQAETFKALRRLAAAMCGTMFLMLTGDFSTLVPGRFDDVPTLAQFYARLTLGEVDLRSSGGQAIFGATLLREAIAP
jgi:aminoglycoside phosphotransferase (APT) family kinase protein